MRTVTFNNSTVRCIHTNKNKTKTVSLAAYKSMCHLLNWIEVEETFLNKANFQVGTANKEKFCSR